MAGAGCAGWVCAAAGDWKRRVVEKMRRMRSGDILGMDMRDGVMWR